MRATQRVAVAGEPIVGEALEPLVPPTELGRGYAVVEKTEDGGMVLPHKAIKFDFVIAARAA
jgi:hypothetical protein